MAKIIIPQNQIAKAGEMIELIINNTFIIHIKSISDTSTASYNEVFNSDEFNRSRHGFTGINDTLEQLCKILK